MSEFLTYILASYNVWFTAPIAFVFLFAIVQLVMGGLDFGGDADVDVDGGVDVDVGADADIDIGADADVGVDVDADVDVEVDVDADVDVEADVDADADSGSYGGDIIATVLALLHVGKVPFMVILMSLFATWGISGLVANELLNINANATRLGIPTVWISLASAFVCSIFGTRYLALGLSKIFPESERAITDYHLIGLRGRVISGRVTVTFGTARVSVPDGPELTVSCRIRDGQDVPLKGDTVVLVDYDSERRIFDVTKVDSMLNA